MPDKSESGQQWVLEGQGGGQVGPLPSEGRPCEAEAQRLRRLGGRWDGVFTADLGRSLWPPGDTTL